MKVQYFKMGKCAWNFQVKQQQLLDEANKKILLEYQLLQFQDNLN